jgi:hypothetical protein
VFESPAKNYPDSFFGKIRECSYMSRIRIKCTDKVLSQSALFTSYPYLLPTLIAAFVLVFGALLATRLSWDGGPRRPRIALPLDKEEEDSAAVASTVNPPQSPAAESTAGTLRKKASSVFGGVNASSSDALDLTPAQMRVATLKDEEAQDRNRRASRASFGTAYG